MQSFSMYDIPEHFREVTGDAEISEKRKQYKEMLLKIREKQHKSNKMKHLNFPEMYGVFGDEPEKSNSLQQTKEYCTNSKPMRIRICSLGNNKEIPRQISDVQRSFFEKRRFSYFANNPKTRLEVQKEYANYVNKMDVFYSSKHHQMKMKHPLSRSRYREKREIKEQKQEQTKIKEKTKIKVVNKQNVQRAVKDFITRRSINGQPATIETACKLHNTCTQSFQKCLEKQNMKSLLYYWEKISAKKENSLHISRSKIVTARTINGTYLRCSNHQRLFSVVHNSLNNNNNSSNPNSISFDMKNGCLSRGQRKRLTRNNITSRETKLVINDDIKKILGDAILFFDKNKTK